MSLSLTANQASSGGLTAAQKVAAILSNDGASCRLFLAAGATSSTGLPTLTAAPVQVTQVDGAFGGSGSSVGGPWKFALTVAATDTVNVSSPLEFMVSNDAIVITATG